LSATGGPKDLRFGFPFLDHAWRYEGNASLSPLGIDPARATGNSTGIKDRHGPDARIATVPIRLVAYSRPWLRYHESICLRVSSLAIPYRS